MPPPWQNKPEISHDALDIEKDGFSLALETNVEAVFALAGFLCDERFHAMALFYPV